VFRRRRNTRKLLQIARMLRELDAVIGRPTAAPKS
jgi:hypothetical protein